MNLTRQQAQRLVDDIAADEGRVMTTVPKAGDHVQTLFGGGGSFFLCTVRLDTPYLDRREKVVTRIEAELPIAQERIV